MNVPDVLKDEIIATGIDFETFLEKYMDQSAEWINGEVIKKMPISGTHNEISGFLYSLFNYYLSKTNAGTVRFEKFTMRLKDFAPEPDVLVVTTSHLERLHETYLDGAADLVVEIVSQSSSGYDRGFKFDAYEANGVREYWIVDPLRNECLFYVLDDKGVYQQNPPDVEGIYSSKILPKLRLKVDLLFQNPLPGVGVAVELVNQMLA